MTANLAQYFTRHLARPELVLYRVAAGDGWRDVAVAELGLTVARWQAAYLRAGLVLGDRVALCARNGVPWVAADLAALGLGLVVVPLYVDDNADNLAWCIADVEAKLVIVETARQAGALGRSAQPAGTPSAIVVLRATDDEADRVGATPVGRFLPECDAAPIARALPERTLATICYTSGTGGRPKGVMLSHGNVIANVESCAATDLARPDDRFLSMLPLSHMFERTGGYYLPLSLGARVAFARGIAQLADDFVTQAPTVVFAVPRIFERFRARIDQALAASPARRRLFDACVTRGYRVAQREATLLDRLLAPWLRRQVAAPVLARFGGSLRLAVVGGAALDPALARVFIGLGVTLLQGYGTTEASPVVSVNRRGDNVPASVGAPLPGVEVKTLPSGELLVRGANVMQGYWRNEAATRAALDDDGWLHTGDLGAIRDGKIHILGRAKEVLILSNGEKLPPQDVELAILRDPVFEQVMLVGEGRPFVTLLAVSPETDEKALVKRANAQLTGFPRWIRVRRVLATRDSWSADDGLLTPTLKLRRPQVLARFRDRIEHVYGGLRDDA